MADSLDLEAAHSHSDHHRPEIEASAACGCFYCLAVYAPGTITRWVDEGNGETAICPACGIDSVLGDASGLLITDDFLRAMKRHWFEAEPQ